MARLLTFALIAGLAVADHDHAHGPSTVSTNTITSSASLPSPSGVVIGVTIPDGTTVSDDLVASVVAVESSLTTLVVQCPEGFDTAACDFYPPVTVTAGPTTFALTAADPEQLLTYTQACSLSPQGGVCEYVYIGNIDGVSSSGASNGASTNLPTQSYSTSVNVAGYVVYPITVTAGPTTGLNTEGAVVSSTGNSVVSTSTGSGSGSSRSNPATMTTTSSSVSSIASPALAHGLAAPTGMIGVLAGMAVLLV